MTNITLFGTNKRKILATLLSILFVLLCGILVYLSIKKYRAEELNPENAPIINWSGGGTDATCGGQVGSGNWWSCASNWSGGVVPTVNDHVVFGSNSVKDSVIDSAFGGTVNGITIYQNYTGKIDQHRSLNVVRDFNQNGASFNSNPTYSFNVGGSFFVADNQVTNGTVFAIRGDSNGNIYIGGTFQNISGLPIKYAAKFDGKKWNPLGPGLDGEVNVIAIDSNNKVYCGGKFRKSGDLTLNGIGMWDGAAWNSLQGGVLDGYGDKKIPSAVMDIEVDEANKVYVGGSFLHAGNLENVNHLARWNGSNWERIGFGVGNSVYADKGAYDPAVAYVSKNIVTYNNTFYVCIKSSTGNLPTNTTYWKVLEMPDTLVGYVKQIIIKNNIDPSATNKDLYIGGSFNEVCGNELCTANNIAGKNLIKYDGLNNTFTAMGGLKNALTAMAFDSSDRLNVYSNGGVSATSGSTCSLGYFDGTNWLCQTEWAIVPNNTIYTMRNLNGSIYVGGSNSHPGSITKMGSGSLGYGLNGNVYDMDIIGGSIYVAGSFNAANTTWTPGSGAGTQIGSIAKYNPSETNRGKQLIAPFSKGLFSRYAGDGSLATPYQITDIYSLQAALNYPDKHFVLANDIDASVSDKWNNGQKFLPIGSERKPYLGQFNGANHAINNLKIANVFQDAGLFGLVGSGGRVSNLNLVNADLTTSNYSKNMGLLIGKNLGLVSNIKVLGSLTVTTLTKDKGYNLGGVVGYSDNLDYRTGDIAIPSLSDIEANVNINASNINYIGGILGNQMRTYVKNSGTATQSKLLISFNNLSSAGMLNVANSDGSIGGLIGRQDYEYGVVNNGHSTMIIGVNINNADLMVDQSVEGIGGLVGYGFGTINTSYTSGDININSSLTDININGIGGLVGDTRTVLLAIPSITDSYSLSNIDINGSVGLLSKIGGLAGSVVTGPITNSYSSGTVTINSSGELKSIGGLVGYANQSPVGQSYSTSKLVLDNHTAANQAATSGIGGLIGISSDNDLNNVRAEGNIQFNADTSCELAGGVGGLVGIYSSLLSHRAYQVYAKGNIDANCSQVGGLMGVNAGVVDQAFALGSVHGSKKTGGLVGQASGMNGKVSNTFSFGAVSGGENTGSLIGYAKDTLIMNSYSNGKVPTGSPALTLVGGNDTRDTVMTNNSDYANWDFMNVWTNNTGAPSPVLLFAKDLWPSQSLAPAPSPQGVPTFTYQPKIAISGTKSTLITRVIVNNVEATLNNVDNTWVTEINLAYGQNVLTVVGKDQENNVSSSVVTVIRRRIADANNDTSINDFDFTLLLYNWGVAKSRNVADFNEDGKVDDADFTLLMYWWGK